MTHDRPERIDVSAFTADVMRSVASRPRPTPSRAFVQAVRDRSPRDAASALWVAWHLATARGWSVAPTVRVRSLALVLGVVLAMGGASLVAARTAQVIADVAIHGIDAFQRSDDTRGDQPEQSGGEQQQGQNGPSDPNGPNAHDQRLDGPAVGGSSSGASGGSDTGAGNQHDGSHADGNADGADTPKAGSDGDHANGGDETDQPAHDQTDGAGDEDGGASSTGDPSDPSGSGHDSTDDGRSGSGSGHGTGDGGDSGHGGD